jgi:hypothetical protein
MYLKSEIIYMPIGIGLDGLQMEYIKIVIPPVSSMKNTHMIPYKSDLVFPGNKKIHKRRIRKARRK